MTETATTMKLDDEVRHRREEQERRAKRKASKISKSDAQREKDRKSKEYRQKILQQHGHSKRSKTTPLTAVKSSAFQDLFAQRAQGFQIDFRFRNAPPRPPVGPCFVGDSLDAVLLQQSRQYKPFNAVEAQYVWKLHNEPDLGVPLAPSAMDLQAYSNPGREEQNDSTTTSPLHPDDQALLDWKGSLGDTAADERQVRQEKARAAARQWLQGGTQLPKAKKGGDKNKKAFSRVLKEDMQTWMKKTTYLSNDYSRKVHDFKSLAQTKQELAADLQVKQDEMAQQRSVRAVEASFDDKIPLRHPTNKKLKPVSTLPLLPNVVNWGRSFTNVVIDKAPNLPSSHAMQDLGEGAFVANVEVSGPNARRSCQLMVPQQQREASDNSNRITPVHKFDLDVLPLKEDGAPYVNFCLWVDKTKGVASYLPIASRIQLSTGRPVRGAAARIVERRPLTLGEEREMEERMAEVDRDMAEKHHLTQESTPVAASDKKKDDKDNDDGEDDFGDDDSDSDDEVFGGATKTIVAED